MQRQKQALEDAIIAVESEYAAAAAPPEEGPEDHLESIFAELKGGRARIEPLAAATTAAGEPWAEPEALDAPSAPVVKTGPKLQLLGGKLSAASSIPPGNEIAPQRALHDQLRKAARATVAHTASMANRFPELVATIEEYANLVDTETESLDVVGTWSAGSALHSFAVAYDEQNTARTLSEPLEPAVAAQLQNITRLHGALMMGFDESRDLVERADESLLDARTIAEASQFGDELLKLFAEDARLVDDRTRHLNRPVRDYVTEFGWDSSRVGYTAFLIVRNSCVAMIRLSVGQDPTAATIISAAAGGSLLFGDPNADFIRMAVQAIHLHGAQMLAFFNHSPELRSYVDWAIHAVKLDGEAHP